MSLARSRRPTRGYPVRRVGERFCIGRAAAKRRFARAVSPSYYGAHARPNAAARGALYVRLEPGRLSLGLLPHNIHAAADG